MIIQSDYHIHASFYRVKRETDDPGPTAAEQLAAARAAGSVYVGVLEHCNASSKHPFYCLEELAKEYYSPGFPAENVFLGVEADLNDDGSDFCGTAGRKKLGLHYVIGSVHTSPAALSFDEYLALEHRCIVNALKYNSNVDIIGHPFGEGKRWVKSGDIEYWHWGSSPKTTSKISSASLLKPARRSKSTAATLTIRSIWIFCAKCGMQILSLKSVPMPISRIAA